MFSTYRICLGDYEALLQNLASIIDAEYQTGTFTEFEDHFHKQSLPAIEWTLSGELGRLTVKLKQYEGYHISEFQSSGAAFSKGTALLWQSYMEQGGNPNAQTPPPAA